VLPHSYYCGRFYRLLERSLWKTMNIPNPSPPSSYCPIFHQDQVKAFSSLFLSHLSLIPTDNSYESELPFICFSFYFLQCWIKFRALCTLASALPLTYIPNPRLSFKLWIIPCHFVPQNPPMLLLTLAIKPILLAYDLISSDTLFLFPTAKVTMAFWGTFCSSSKSTLFLPRRSNLQMFCRLFLD
jgi:hypothetical protein